MSLIDKLITAGVGTAATKSIIQSVSNAVANIEKAKATSGEAQPSNAIKEQEESAPNVTYQPDAEREEKVVMEEPKFVFCSNCGTKMTAGSKFCHSCGAQIYVPTSESNGDFEPSQRETSCESQKSDVSAPERKAGFEGEIHKCPNCGEILKSFLSTCPSCGYEIRNAKAIRSVEEFERRLSSIESRIMPPIQDNSSFMKKVFGKDFNKEDAEREARWEFEEQKEQEKISLILNYPIPNTREDLLEFAFLVSSNVNNRKDDESDDVEKAWSSKLEQIQQKAQLILKDPNDLDQVNRLVCEVKAKKKREKRANALGIIIPFGVILLICIVLLILAKLGIVD